MKEIKGIISASGLSFGIVVSRFNDLFTRNNLQGALDCIVQHGGSEDAVTTVWVPGSFEIPMALQALAKKGGHDVLIGLGVVIQGSTDHADLITQNVARQCADLSREYGIPVIDGVIGARSIEQAMERSGAKQGNRGWSSVLAGIEMVSVLGRISS